MSIRQGQNKNPDIKRDQYRAFNPTTQMWLHIGGDDEVKETTYAWRGSKRQFERVSTWSKRKKYKLIPDVAGGRSAETNLTGAENA